MLAVGTEEEGDLPVDELARPDRPGRGRLGADRELLSKPKLRSKEVGGAVLTLLGLRVNGESLWLERIKTTYGEAIVEIGSFKSGKFSTSLSEERFFLRLKVLVGKSLLGKSGITRFA